MSLRRASSTLAVGTFLAAHALGCGGSSPSSDVGPVDAAATDAGGGSRDAFVAGDGASSDVGADAFAGDAGPPSGSLDPSFGMHGIVTDVGFGSQNNGVDSIAVQADGAVIVGGSVNPGDPNLFVARLLPNGTSDTNFGANGAYAVNRDPGGSETVNGLLVLPNGNILGAVDANRVLTVLELDSTGTLVDGFGTHGFTEINVGGLGRSLTLAVDSMGRIVVAGTDYTNFVVARLTATGQPDTTFHGGTPIVLNAGGTVDGAYALAIDTDDSIAVAGTALGATGGSGFVARFTSAGVPVTSFGGTGMVVTPMSLYGVWITSSGLLVAGSDTMGAVLSRYSATGSVDTTFGMNGLSRIAGPVGSISAAVRAATGNVYGAGTNNDVYVCAWLPTGSTDTAFGNSGAASQSVGPSNDGAHAIAVAHDGRILVAGFTITASSPTTTFNPAILRYFP
jgi:uncharacterized delta-60 repeat protein